MGCFPSRQRLSCEPLEESNTTKAATSSPPAPNPRSSLPILEYFRDNSKLKPVAFLDIDRPNGTAVVKDEGDLPAQSLPETERTERTERSSQDAEEHSPSFSELNMPTHPSLLARHSEKSHRRASRAGPVAEAWAASHDGTDLESQQAHPRSPAERSRRYSTDQATLAVQPDKAEGQGLGELDGQGRDVEGQVWGMGKDGGRRTYGDSWKGGGAGREDELVPFSSVASMVSVSSFDGATVPVIMTSQSDTTEPPTQRSPSGHPIISVQEPSPGNSYSRPHRSRSPSPDQPAHPDPYTTTPTHDPSTDRVLPSPSLSHVDTDAPPDPDLGPNRLPSGPKPDQTGSGSGSRTSSRASPEPDSHGHVAWGDRGQVEARTAAGQKEKEKEKEKNEEFVAMLQAFARGQLARKVNAKRMTYPMALGIGVAMGGPNGPRVTRSSTVGPTSSRGPVFASDAGVARSPSSRRTAKPVQDGFATVLHRQGSASQQSESSDVTISPFGSSSMDLLIPEAPATLLTSIHAIARLVSGTATGSSGGTPQSPSPTLAMISSGSAGSRRVRTGSTSAGTAATGTGSAGTSMGQSNSRSPVQGRRTEALQQRRASSKGKGKARTSSQVQVKVHPSRPGSETPDSVSSGMPSPMAAVGGSHWAGTRDPTLESGSRRSLSLSNSGPATSLAGGPGGVGAGVPRDRAGIVLNGGDSRRVRGHGNKHVHVQELPSARPRSESGSESESADVTPPGRTSPVRQGDDGRYGSQAGKSALKHQAPRPSVVRV